MHVVEFAKKHVNHNAEKTVRLETKQRPKKIELIGKCLWPDVENILFELSTFNDFNTYCNLFFMSVQHSGTLAKYVYGYGSD